jgi:uncharacterized protein YjbI with pentapeptide repeats
MVTEAGPPKSVSKGATKSRAPQPSQTGGLPGLQAAVNDASSRAAGLWLSFLTFMAYLTMTVGAVNHEALLRQTAIKLPVLNVELPLVGFFWIAPLFFLLFHFYLFLQLVILVRKLASFDVILRTAVPTEQEQEEYRQRLDTFLIVQFLSGAEEERKGLTGRLLRYVALITLVILPILLLLQFQLTFVPYHDAWVTWVHRIAILIDTRLAWVFWFAISKGEGEIYFPEIQLGRIGFFRRNTFLQAIPRIITGVGSALRIGYRKSRLGFFGSLGVILISFFVFAFADEPIATVFKVPVPRISGEEIVWEYKSIADVVLQSPIDMVNGRPRAWFSNVLVVPNRKIVDDKAAETDFPSLSLRGRNLSGAILIGSDLRNADFTGANLNHAHLDRALLARARFGCAAPFDKHTKPGWPDDECTWLQRASFAQAELQAADFKRARMHDAILIAANLQGADLSAAQLQGAMLSNAKLVGAWLKGANLNYAFLDGANLIGATFFNTQLQGVLLGKTLLHLASIRYVSSASLDKIPVRIAKAREGGEGDVRIAKVRQGGEGDGPADDPISGQFLYATVDPVDPTLNSEDVSASFDLRTLSQFRQAAVASLIPYGVVERPDFEAVYEHAVEMKWNEIAGIVKGKRSDDQDERIKAYLIQLACSPGSAQFITEALIRNERVMLAGQQAIEVIEALKNPTEQCLGAKSLKPGLKVLLGDLEQRAKASGRSADNKSGPVDEPGGSVAAGLSPEPSAKQVTAFH